MCEFLGRELECREVRFCRRVFCAGFSFGGESLLVEWGLVCLGFQFRGGLALVSVSGLLCGRVHTRAVPGLPPGERETRFSYVYAVGIEDVT